MLDLVRQYQTMGALTLIGLLIVWETFAPYFPFFRGQSRHRIWHISENVSFAIINILIQRFFFVGLWLAAAVWAQDAQFGVANWLGLSGWQHALVAVLLFDVWTYWWHRINHEVPFFWRFHHMHHSDPHMDVSTSYRFHMGEMALSSTLRIPLIALFGAELWELALFDGLMFACVQFHHANIGLPERMDKLFRVFFTSPHMHKVHHSNDPGDYNSNYTALLSVWDRIFGSFRLHQNPHHIGFGIQGWEDDSHQSFTSLLRTPLTVYEEERAQKR